MNYRVTYTYTRFKKHYIDIEVFTPKGKYKFLQNELMYLAYKSSYGSDIKILTYKII